MLSRFVIAGALNTGATYLLYLVLVRAMPYVAAYTVSYLAGIAIGYALNVWWVFRTRASVQSASVYPLAYVANYLLGVGLLWMFVQQFGAPAAVAPLLVLPISVPLMYLMSRFIFRKNP